MNEPHVAQFWDQAWTAERWAGAIAGQLAGDHSRPHLVSHEGVPLAYVEIYRTPSDPARHKETEHYATWRDAVANMMAEPRSSVKFQNVFPDDQGW